MKCPYCNSTDTRPKGHRETVTLGRRLLRICRSCKRRFTVKSKDKTKTKGKHTRK